MAAYLKILFLACCTFITSLLRGQEDSCHLKVSLLTCSPGEELYSTFGHTAIRVKNSISGEDYVFNYGTFEFSPDFYKKFVLGRLLYSLSVQNFQDFIFNYQLESRSIIEQDINYSCAEKEQLIAALHTNAEEENRHYLYDFLFDNCTTRARDMVAKNSAAAVRFGNFLPPDTPSFRDLIHSYLNAGGQFWSKLGIDMLLGARMDRRVTNIQAMFLPDYLMKGFDNAKSGMHPLVQSRQTILSMPPPFTKHSLFRPAVVFSSLLAAALLLTFIRHEKAGRVLTAFDFFIFFFTGLAGCIMLFMWFGTDHVLCRDNLNLLWALPSHLIVAFFIHQKKDWLKKYFQTVFIVTILLLLSWFFIPQNLNESLLPIILLIALRSAALGELIPYAKNNRV